MLLDAYEPSSSWVEQLLERSGGMNELHSLETATCTRPF